MVDPYPIPEALTVRRYRGYADTQALELKPLTLLFGWNNAGKSALLRAAPLLADSIRARGQRPLNLSGAVIRGAQFDDVKWRGDKDLLEGEPRDVAMALGLRWADDLGMEAGFDWPDRRTVKITAVRFGDRWWREVLTRDRDAHAEPDARRGAQAQLAFETIDEPRETLALTASGLSLTPGKDASDDIREATHRWNAFGEMVQWLSSTRRPHERVHPYSGLTGQSRLLPDGGDIIGWLVEHPALLARINQTWYEPHLKSRLVINELDPTGFECRLVHESDARLSSHILDTGEGNIQVLPVLAALAAAASGEGPPIVAIEEPESHLHPDLQAKLAEQIIAVTRENSDARVMLETHSEHLLLAVQAQVLQGMNPDDIGLYWVEQRADGRSVAERVGIAPDGTFDHVLPPGVFDATLRMSRQIMRLQVARATEAGAPAR